MVEISNAKNKTEQARLMEIKIPEDDYWGDYSSKTCGSVGGAIGDNFTKALKNDTTTVSNYKD